MSLAAVGLSLIDETPRELLYLSAFEIAVCYTASAARNTITAKVSKLQALLHAPQKPHVPASLQRRALRTYSTEIRREATTFTFYQKNEK